MKITSMAQASAFVADFLNDIRRKNREAMAADGWSQEDIAAFERQCKDVGQYHSEVMTQIERFLSEPDAPSHRTQ